MVFTAIERDYINRTQLTTHFAQTRLARGEIVSKMLSIFSAHVIKFGWLGIGHEARFWNWC